MTTMERVKKMQRLCGVLAVLGLLMVALRMWEWWVLAGVVGALSLIFAGMLAHLWWEEWGPK